MLKYFEIQNKKVVENSRGPILVYITPSEIERKELITNFLIDEHTLSSALDPDEPARAEQEPDHLALIFKRPKNYSGDERFLFKVSSVGFFIFKDKLVIILSEDIPLFIGKSFASVETIEEVFLKLLSLAIHHYLEHLRVITQITEEIESLISSSMENKYLLNLFSLEKSLVYYLSAINSNSFALERLKILGTKVGFPTIALELIDDLLVENTQCYRQAEIHSSILANLMDARVSIVSNNLNILMKTLNLVTIFIMVPTLVVSMFSMNVSIPLEKHPMAFWIILAFSFLSIMFVMIWWFTFSRKLTKNGSKHG